MTSYQGRIFTDRRNVHPLHRGSVCTRWSPLNGTSLPQRCWARYIPWESTFVRKNAHTELRLQLVGQSQPVISRDPKKTSGGNFCPVKHPLIFLRPVLGAGPMHHKNVEIPWPWNWWQLLEVPWPFMVEAPGKVTEPRGKWVVHVNKHLWWKGGETNLPKNPSDFGGRVSDVFFLFSIGGSLTFVPESTFKFAKNLRCETCSETRMRLARGKWMFLEMPYPDGGDDCSILGDLISQDKV